MEERKKEKKENSTELQKPNVEAEVYNKKKCDWEKKKNKKKKRKSLIRFHSANKIDNYNRGGGKKGKKIQKNLQNKSKHKNNKCFSWVTAVRFLSLAGSHSLPHLPRMPSNTADLWTCCGGSSDSNWVLVLCSCLQCPQLSELVCFLLWELSMTFYIFHRDCLSSWSCGFNL